MSSLHPRKSGKSCILGPYLYLVLSADTPLTDHTTITTFADDAAILTGDIIPQGISSKLQILISFLQDWFKKYKVKVITAGNSSKIISTTKR